MNRFKNDIIRILRREGIIFKILSSFANVEGMSCFIIYYYFLFISIWFPFQTCFGSSKISLFWFFKFCSVDAVSDIRHIYIVFKNTAVCRTEWSMFVFTLQLLNSVKHTQFKIKLTWPTKHEDNEISEIITLVFMLSSTKYSM